MKEHIAIILPAYNEAATIAQSIESFSRALPDAEIVVINNNSSDRTAEIAGDTLERLNANGRVLHELRQGKANAVRRAFLSVNADIYVLVDADMTYPADCLQQLIEPVRRDEAEMVVGDRLSGGHYEKENKRGFHQFGNRLVIGLVNLLYGAKLSDVMSGYRVFSRRFVKNYPILVSGFELETDMTLHALDKRFRIVEIPIEYVDRPEGSVSKLNTFSDGIKVLAIILQIFRHYKPLAFFGFMSVMMALAALLVAVPVFDDWIVHRYIYHVPSAVLAAALGLLSAITISLGLVLDSIAYQYKMRVENKLLADSEAR